jgi:hypothetical protein
MYPDEPVRHGGNGLERQMPEAHLIEHMWSIQVRKLQRKHRE